MTDTDLIPNFANQSLSCADFMTKAQIQNPRLFPCTEAWLANKPWPIADQMTTREIRTNVTNAKTLITLLENTDAKLATLRASPQTLAITSMIMAQINIKTAVEGKLIQAFGFIPTLAQYTSPIANSTKKNQSNNLIYAIMSIIAAIIVVIIATTRKKDRSNRSNQAYRSNRSNQATNAHDAD